MKALIDADIIIYEAASLCETAIAWPHETGDGEHDCLWTRTADKEEAVAKLQSSIAVLTEKVGATEAILAVTSPTNWRYDFYGDYKSNRASGVKPMLVPVLRDVVAGWDNGRRIPGLEGDDILGILQTKPGAGETICITIDKDLKTIPGKHYNFREGRMFEVTEGEANQFHLQQALMGDATDGYPGCRGIGWKKAENLLPDPVPSADVYEVWNDVIVPAFVNAGFDESFALSQARVARILRACDYDPKQRKVIPWTPS